LPNNEQLQYAWRVCGRNSFLAAHYCAGRYSHTEKKPDSGTAPSVRRINSMIEYHELFGGAFAEVFKGFKVEKVNDKHIIKERPGLPSAPKYSLYYHLQMFYANGGGPCYIVSVGNYPTPITRDHLEAGLTALKSEDEPTLILIPDAQAIASSTADYYALYQSALLQCAELKDRFTIIDPHDGNALAGIDTFRTDIGANHLSYGAAYFPSLVTTLRYGYNETAIEVEVEGSTPTLFKLRDDANAATSLYHEANDAYNQILSILDSFQVTLPPSGAIAGIYAQVDNSRGVFKAPANVSLSKVVKPTLKLSNQDQDGLNAPSNGKAVNAIRSFTDKGVMVWGARTLDANSSEWRYVPVRRFFNFAEESISKTIDRFVFEPNNANTWVLVKGAIESFLTDQWRAGALAGNTPEQAFFVHIGLGETMTPQDILAGRMIVMIGMAAVRPAEFIILRFTHKLQEA
jgi:uncharacterized protein